MIDKGTVYICDEGYIDYKKFDSYTSKKIYFVSRLKDNAKFKEAIDLPINHTMQERSIIVTTRFNYYI